MHLCSRSNPAPTANVNSEARGKLASTLSGKAADAAQPHESLLLERHRKRRHCTLATSVWRLLCAAFAGKLLARELCSSRLLFWEFSFVKKKMSDPQPVKLSYTCTEPRSGVQSDLPPLILHHGLISTKRGWEGLLEPLAEKTNRKVYAIDARNHGDSEKSEVFNFNILATDLDHFMETMKIPKATIIGHCMGGMVAMITALTKPERVEKIIIEDVSPKELKPEMYHVLVDMLKEQVDCLEKVSADEEEATVQQKLRECIYRTIPMIPDEDRDVLQRVQFPLRKTDKGYEVSTNLKVIARAFEDYESLLEQHSGEFEGNALFIYGTKSTFDVPNDKDFILQLFPKAHFHGIESAGHEVHSQCPEEFLEEVVKFLK